MTTGRGVFVSDIAPAEYDGVLEQLYKIQQAQQGRMWESSEPFVRIRQRDELGGRCGKCEFGSSCGGCRARAYGSTGDYLAEDALCTHQPGTAPDARARLHPKVEYGTPEVRELEWEPAARERMQAVPAFVRGMVVRAVESSCRKRGLSTVTCDELDEIRSRMPASRIFAGRN